MNGFSFSTTFTASFGFRSCASTAVRLTHPFAFEGRGSALQLCAFGLGLAALAGDTPAECFERLL